MVKVNENDSAVWEGSRETVLVMEKMKSLAFNHKFAKILYFPV